MYEAKGKLILGDDEMEKEKVIECTTKEERCKFCHRFMGKSHNESHCVVEGWENDKVKIVTAEYCNQCDQFKSKFIEYPLTINGIKNKKIDTTGLGHKCGCLCEIHPCGEEYIEKSYLGIYLGDLPIMIASSYSEESGTLTNTAVSNPAIFVPELKKIIYGCESWWREIQTIEDFKGISEEDINNTWYVQLLKSLK